MYADWLATNQNQHVATAYKLVGSLLVKNGARVNLRHHTEGHTAREVGLNGTSDDIGCRALRGNNHMDTHGTCQLGNTGYRQFNFFTCCHDQVAKLIDNDYDVWHVIMTLRQVEFVVDELLVVLLHIAGTGHFQQVVTRVHEFAERVESAHHFRNIGDDGLFFVLGQRGHEVAGQWSIDAELHFLRVYEHELQFVGMLLI